MRQSKVALLATGWKPVGWHKYPSNKRLSGRDYYFIGREREHKVLAEQLLGRELKPNELVHHKDRNKLNNNVTNLEVMLRGDHTRLHNQRRLANVTTRF